MFKNVILSCFNMGCKKILPERYRQTKRDTVTNNKRHYRERQNDLKLREEKQRKNINKKEMSKTQKETKGQ